MPERSPGDMPSSISEAEGHKPEEQEHAKQEQRKKLKDICDKIRLELVLENARSKKKILPNSPRIDPAIRMDVVYERGRIPSIAPEDVESFRQWMNGKCQSIKATQCPLLTLQEIHDVVWTSFVNTAIDDPSIIAPMLREEGLLIERQRNKEVARHNNAISTKFEFRKLPQIDPETSARLLESASQGTLTKETIKNFLTISGGDDQLELAIAERTEDPSILVSLLQDGHTPEVVDICLDKIIKQAEQGVAPPNPNIFDRILASDLWSDAVTQCLERVYGYSMHQIADIKAGSLNVNRKQGENVTKLPWHIRMMEQSKAGQLTADEKPPNR